MKTSFVLFVICFVFGFNGARKLHESHIYSLMSVYSRLNQRLAVNLINSMACRLGVSVHLADLAVIRTEGPQLQTTPILHVMIE